MLTYNGSTKGMSGNQKVILKGMTQVMNESATTNVIYGKSIQMTDTNNKTITFNASVAGGTVTY
jgi:hypothetical protein